MKNLLGNHSALSAACLVSREWSTESSRVLFNLVFINMDRRPLDADWLETLKDSERVPANVRTLRMRAFEGFCQRRKGWRPPPVFECLFQAILCLPNLRSLEFYWAHLSLGPGEKEALEQLQSKELSLQRLNIECIPFGATTQHCYVRLLQALTSLEELYLGSNDKWGQLDGAAYLQLQELPHAAPLRVKHVTIACCSALPLLDWICGALGPSPLDTDHIESLEIPVYPESAVPNTPTVPCLKLLDSITALCELKLNIPIAPSEERLTGMHRP